MAGVEGRRGDREARVRDMAIHAGDPDGYKELDINRRKPNTNTDEKTVARWVEFLRSIGVPI